MSASKLVKKVKAKAVPIQIQVCVVVPILEIRGFDSKWSQEYFEVTIRELLAFSEADFKLGFRDYPIENFRIQLLKKPKRKKSRTVTINGMKLPRLWQHLNVSFTCTLTLVDFSIQTASGKPDKSLTLAQRQAMHAQIACEQFASVITQLLLATQIAKPDVLAVDEIELYLFKRFLKTADSVHRLCSIGEFIDRQSWPVIEALPICSVWQWLCSSVPLAENLGKTPVDRALNAFTYLVKDEPAKRSELESLMWAMVGLEALYGRGASDLTYQLVEKVGVLLGKNERLEKLVREMYRFRSLFIHGKADFPSAFFDAYGLPEYDKYMKKSDVTARSIAILIASLQQLVKRNWKNLGFSFIADDPPHEI
jgi:hypothetical protein